MSAAPPPADVPFGVAARQWARIGLLSFGGPAGQIALMHRELVERRRWLDEDRFLHALNYCMLLPGPEAMQLATYAGWLLHGIRGGLVAGALFVLPGFASILLLSWLYAAHGGLAWVAALFYGLGPAVIAIVLDAVVRIGKRALRSGLLAGLAATAFVAIFFYQVPFPAIVVAAGLAGLLAGWLWPGQMPGAGAPGADASPPPRRAGRRRAGMVWRSVRILAAGLLLWALPVAACAAWLGRDHILVAQGIFFSKMAALSFGGAYAVLAWVAQAAVEQHGWLSSGQMLDGLGLAETTPGPLIQVVQFVGFMGAWKEPAPFSPAGAALLASVLVTWVTFVPCFLWIFLGAPFVERLRSARWARRALSGVTAAVVGVILNLSIWFSLHTLFGEVGEARWLGARLLLPRWETLDPFQLGVAVAALAALRLLRADLLWVVAGAAAAGLLQAALAGAL